MKIRTDRIRWPVRADFELLVDEPAKEIRIIDEDLGNMSVTNDLDRVLVEVATQVDRSLDEYAIVYRDSTGTWDRVVVTPDPVLAHTFNVDIRPGPRDPGESRDPIALEEPVKVFPMARRTDPLTSHIAALRHVAGELSTRRAQVYDVVARYPDKTSNELGVLMMKAFPELSVRAASASPQKRLPELEKLGLIVRGEARECTDSGYLAHTWRAIDIEAQPSQAELAL